MNPAPDARRIKTQLLIWWILWASILAGQVLVYLLIAQGKPLPAPASADFLRNLMGFVPLFLSIIIRWLVLPRYTDPQRALVVFIMGLALAESCGMLGIFLGGPYRDALFLLGVLGVFQYLPVFARKFFEPKVSGFIPNN